MAVKVIGTGGSSPSPRDRKLSAWSPLRNSLFDTGSPRRSTWYAAALLCLAMCVACLVANLFSAIADAVGTRLLILAFLTGAGALAFGFVGAARRLTEILSLIENAARRDEAAVLTQAAGPSEVELGQGASDAVSRFVETVVAPRSARLAATMEMATRAVGAQENALRSRLESAGQLFAANWEASATAFGERLRTEQAQMKEALDLYSQSILSRVNIASVALVREFRDSADATQLRLESTGEQLISVLNRSSAAAEQAVARAASSAERDASERAKATIASIESALNEASQKLAADSETALRRFEQTAATLGETLAVQLRDRVQDADTRARTLLTTLNTHSETLDEKTRDAAQALERAVSTAQESLGATSAAALSRIEAKLGVQIADIASKLERAEKDVSARWKSQVGELNADVRQSAEAAFSAMAERLEAARSRFTGDLDRSAEELDARTQALSLALLGSLDSAIGAVENGENKLVGRLAAFEIALDARTASVSQDLASQTDALQAALEAGVETLSARHTTLKQALDGSVRNLDGAFTERMAALSTRLENWRAAVSDALESHRDASEQGVEAHKAFFETLAARQSEALAQALSGHEIATSGMFGQAIDRVQKSAAQQANSARETLETVAQRALEQSAGELARMAERLETQGGAVHERLAARNAELAATLKAAREHNEREAQEHIRAVGELLEAMGDRVSSGLEARGHAVAQQLARATMESTQMLASHSEGVKRALESGASEAEQKLAVVRDRLLAAVAHASGEGAAALQASADAHARAVEASAVAAAERVGAMQNRLTDALDGAAAAFAQRLAETNGQSSGAIGDATEGVLLRLQEGQGRMVDAVQRAAAAAGAAIEAQARATSAELEASAAAAVNRLQDRGASALAVTEDAGSKLRDELAARTSDLRATIASAAERLDRDFGDPLRSTLARLEVEGAEFTSHSRDYADVLAKTAQAHRDELRETLSAAATTLAATLARDHDAFRRELQVALGGTDNEFLERASELAQQLGRRLAELATIAEGDGGRLIQNFESRAVSVAQQVEAASQRSLTEFDRKASGMIALLTRRGDDLLSSMTAAASESARKVSTLAEGVAVETDRTDASLREIERKFNALLAMIERRGEDMLGAANRRFDAQSRALQQTATNE